MTPDRLLGRVNATFRTVLVGALTLGAAVAGVTGQLFGARTALWVAAAGLAVVWIPIYLSVLRTMRELPAPPDQAVPDLGEGRCRDVAAPD